MKLIIILALSGILTVSDSGKNFIKEQEGLRLIAYKCLAGQNTIGYGHTNTNLTKITQAQADSLFNIDIKNIEKELVKYNFNQNQFDAIASFIYNVGIGNFRRSTFSRTLDIKELNK